MGSEQGAGRARRQGARARAVCERAGGGRAPRQGRQHRSAKRRRSCSSPIRRPTDRGRSIQSQSLGSPATYGTIIATWSARSTLIASGMQPDNFTIVQADRWLRGLTSRTCSTRPRLILGAGAIERRDGREPAPNCAEHPAHRPGAERRLGAVRHRARRRSSTPRWRCSRSSTLDVEPRLARSTYRPEELKEAIAKGKTYLVSQQRPDGSWPETTRPADRKATRSASRPRAGRCWRCSANTSHGIQNRNTENHVNSVRLSA